MCAGVLEYESNGEIEDIGFYKDYALAVLTSADTQQQRGRLAVLPSAALARQPLPEGHVGPHLTIQTEHHVQKKLQSHTSHQVPRQSLTRPGCLQLMLCSPKACCLAHHKHTPPYHQQQNHTWPENSRASFPVRRERLLRLSWLLRRCAVCQVGSRQAGQGQMRP